MPNCMVRITEIKIRNLKNVKQGEIKFKNYTKLKKNMDLEKGDMLGIYGPNGSGKSAVIDACIILQYLMVGASLPDKMAYVIAIDEPTAILEFEFFVQAGDDKYIVAYEVELGRDETGRHLNVLGEKLACSTLKEGKWKVQPMLIEYRDKEEQYFKIAPRYKKVLGEDRKLLVRDLQRSFIFNEQNKQIFREKLGLGNPLVELLLTFYQFGYFQLFVIETGHIGLMERLFDTSLIPENKYEAFVRRVKQMDKVLEILVPGLNLGIEQKKEGTSQVVSVRTGRKVPLKYESEGIKKLITILSVLIAVYNRRNICMIVDDLDNRVFEPLLNQLIEIFTSGMEGQLVFTAQSLSTLEKLDKDRVIFTTLNEGNKYIYLEKMSRKKNMRENYLKELHLEAQKEILYASSDNDMLRETLRNAGRMHEVIR
ncbi:MAG: ATP-binding protein [Candidatus Niameybacter stercoravium]|nr:ATP-binding protein [Candidatus Niameybacter stercoravium]